jgi:hypothetical protein
MIISMADNIFIFRLTDDYDVDHIVPAAKMDRNTLTTMTRALPPRRFIAVGEATNQYPIVLNTRRLPIETAGETKLLWK